MVILIIGGNGTTGNEVVKLLRHHQVKIRILTNRQESWKDHAESAELHSGDLHNPAEIANALKGIDRVFLLVVHGPREVQEGLKIIRQCRDAKVEKIVYLSIFRSAAASRLPLFQPKLILEQAIIDSGLNYTFLRPCLFFQNDFWYQTAINAYGIYPQPIGNLGVSRVDLRDVAEMAVKALLLDKYNRQSIPLVGPQILNAEATIQILTEHLGQEVKYLGDDLQSWSVQAKLTRPSWNVDSWVQTYRLIQQQGLIASLADLAQVTEALGRLPRSYHSFVKDHPQYFSCNLINH